MNGCTAHFSVFSTNAQKTEVGDPKQLPNVVVDKDAKYANEVFKEVNLPEGYRFVNNSFLDSILKVFPDVPVTLLKEHYRCHPLIIGFCNKQFYNNQLVIMTKRETEEKPLYIIRSVKGNHARGTHNRRQAEDVIDIVKNHVSSYNDIGIITPYRDQAKLISELLQENGLPDFPVSTVHKFQGRENDVIILSTVSNEIQEFIDDPHLLNVAVSRAKKKFILAVTGNDIKDSNIRDLIDYITYYNGEVKESQICSIFDILYGQYAEERKKEVHTDQSFRISIRVRKYNVRTIGTDCKHAGMESSRHNASVSTPPPLKIRHSPDRKRKSLCQ